MHGSLTFTDDWTLTEDQLRSEPSTGTLFTTSNGYVGVRGGAREPVGERGLALVSGCYETRPYAHPERSYATPERAQTIVAVTDPAVVAIEVDGVALSASTGTWLAHRRALDLRTGCVSTDGTWLSPAGATFRITSARLASLTHRELLRTTVTLELISGRARAVELRVLMCANTADRTHPGEPEAVARAHGRVLRPLGTFDEDDIVGLLHATTFSARSVACAAVLDTTAGDVSTAASADQAEHHVSWTVGDAARSVTVEHAAAFADGTREQGTAVLEGAVRAVRRHRGEPFAAALGQQRERLERFWVAGRVDLDGAPEVQAAIRYCTFQVFQAEVCRPARAAPAKGLTGLGYEGHHLWDHELYAGQLLTALEPAASRAGLEFRIATLDAARARARELGFDGAQYPWRTIDGAEASPFFPAGAAQHHLNADLAWALDHYLDVTGDDGLLAEGGLAMLAETARAWMSIGRFDDEGRFRIEGVTGPDEYTALVDNNLFTSVMAARHLISAADRLDALASDDAVAFDRLVAELGIADEERVRWRRAAAAVVVAYDDGLGVHGQDDGFLQRARWPTDLLSAGGSALQDRHPLLVLYRHQVLKQADVVHAGVLLPERFDAAQRRRDLDYYEPLTSHDSSLSAPIHAIAHADVGRLEDAWNHCRDAATVDLDDHAGTLADGLHLASAAGSWLAVARGFGGFVVRDGRPTFRPRRPPGIARMRFAVRFRGRLIEVIDEPSGTIYTLHHGEPVDLVHHGEQLSLSSTTPSVAGPSRPPDDAERRAVP